MKGSVRKRGKTWTAYWETTDPATGGRRQHSKGGFRIKDDAQGHLNDLIKDVGHGTWRPNVKMTVEKLMEEWLAAKEGENIRPNTLAMYGSVIAGWITPHIGQLPVDQLSPSKAKLMVDALRSEGGSQHGRGELSARSIQLAVQCLKAATRWAFEAGQLSQDPLAGYKRPKAPQSAVVNGAWTTAEATKFLSSVASDRLRAAWWLFLARGPRRGEVAGLKWLNLDLDGGAMRVVETRVVVGSKPTASTPKTDAGRRAVPLDERLVKELKSHRARQAEERIAAGTAWEDSGYVFVDECGHPYRPEHISRRFATLAERAELRAIRLHDLRHTAASLMLAAGESPKVVAEILGHSSPTITQNVYQHLMPGMSEGAGERLTSLLATSGGS